MIVRGHLMDAQALAVLIGRSSATVRAHCHPVREVRGVALYDATKAEAQLADVEDVDLVTAAAAPSRLGIPAGTVRSWACRGRVAQYSTDDNGRPLYRITDLEAEAAKTASDQHKQVG